MKLEEQYLKVSGIGRDSKRYDIIPDECFEGAILDLGCSLGINQLNSRHKERFQKAVSEGRYTGVEAYIPLEPMLPVVRSDIMNYVPDKTFDTILLMDVIEHIQFRDWFVLFPRLKEWLNVGGVIVMTTPYNEDISDYYYHKGYLSCHVVFNIKNDLILHFLPNAEFHRSFYVQKRLIWRDSGESHVRAFLRFVKRRITKHPHGRILKRRHRLSILWKKDKNIIKQ